MKARWIRGVLILAILPVVILSGWSVAEVFRSALHAVQDCRSGRARLLVAVDEWADVDDVQLMAEYQVVPRPVRARPGTLARVQVTVYNLAVRRQVCVQERYTGSVLDADLMQDLAERGCAPLDAREWYLAGTVDGTVVYQRLIDRRNIVQTLHSPPPQGTWLFQTYPPRNPVSEVQWDVIRIGAARVDANTTVLCAHGAARDERVYFFTYDPEMNVPGPAYIREDLVDGREVELGAWWQ